MIRFSKYAGLLILLFLFMVDLPTAEAQSDYVRLAYRNNQQQVYITTFTLPGKNENQLKLITSFQLGNRFLSFKKNHLNDKGAFLSTTALNLEVFKAPEKIRKASRKKRWRREEVDLEGLPSVGRAAWQDTAYAATYEMTKSPEQGLNGSMEVKLSPGFYTYLLKLKRNNRPDNDERQDRNDDRIRNATTRNIHLTPYKSQRNHNVLLVSKVDDPAHPSHLKLINMGQNVIYGNDFYAFIHLPDFQPDKTYHLNITRIKPDEKDTTNIEQVFSQDITSRQLMSGMVPTLDSHAQSVGLNLKKQAEGYHYALVKIPNKKFPNAVYRLSVTDGSARAVVGSTFRSYWSDIPTSLLNLDVAIDMMHYITDDKTLDKIDDGSDRQREKKFRAFWKSKDPTPDTEFNELEAEYYRRIDYAYEHFGSQETPGYESDRGKVYINYGPPQDTERNFPADGATTEIWTYPSKKFIFKATSGFGDFKLVSQKNTHS